jgi:hypothetical protein
VYTRLDIMSYGELLRCTGRVGSYNSCTVKAATDDAIAGQSRVGKLALSVPSVQSCMGEIEDITSSQAKLAAICLVEYHREKTGFKPAVTFPVSESVRTYVPFTSSYDADIARPMGSPFMSPLIHGAFTPGDCYESDLFGITERVTKVANHVEMTPSLERFMQEFLELTIPVPHQLTPFDVDTVYERQDRATQRRILDEACLTGEPERIIRSFMKKEFYGGVKAPRPISTICPVDKLDYSQFTYAVAEFLSSCPWYAFKHTPLK